MSGITVAFAWAAPPVSASFVDAIERERARFKKP